jgi:hypothetical protein
MGSQASDALCASVFPVAPKVYEIPLPIDRRNRWSAALGTTCGFDRQNRHAITKLSQKYLIMLNNTRGSAAQTRRIRALVGLLLTRRARSSASWHFYALSGGNS